MVKYELNKGSLLIYMIGASLFVLLGLLLITGVIGAAEGGTRADELAGIVLGWITIIFFGGLFALSIGLLFDSRKGPIITMDESGFYDRRICSKPIPWNEIKQASIFRGKTLYSAPSKFVSLEVDNPDAYLKQGLGKPFSGLKKLLNTLYDEKGISISTSVLGRSPEELLASIEKEGQVKIKT